MRLISAVSGVRIPAPPPILKVPIRQIVTDTLRQRVLLPRGSRVLAAVSGGSDSVALAFILKDLHDRNALELAGIGHVHHQLRGHEADADENFCRNLAERISVPFFSGRVDVTAAIEAGGGSVESAARRLRYAWLESTATTAGASHIATGHTLDDQAETILMRLLRGASGRGLAGIRAARGSVIRPLLDCRRAELREFLASIGERFRDDATNDDVAIARNRVRHELLPVIERIAPGGLDALARTAALAADDEKYLSAAAIEAAHSVVLTSEGDLSGDRLSALAPAIARRVVRGAIERAAPERAGDITAAHVDAVRNLASSSEPGHLDLAGVAVESDGDVVKFSGAKVHGRTGAQVHGFSYQLDRGGSVAVPEANLVISAGPRDQTGPHGVETDSETKAVRTTLQVSVDAADVKWPLTVRNRRPGDRIKPTGGLGRKKVQDLLVDMKMPRAARDAVAVVVDAGGQLVWVVGVTPADLGRARAASLVNRAEMVVLRAERR
jgi:tRNA(Ile)-lysidine synthase